jgi:signal transduction histidine kinase
LVPTTETPERISTHSGPSPALRELEERCAALERELATVQRFVAIGQLAAGVAHEINTPMQYIGDNTRFLHVTVQRLLELSAGFESLIQSCHTGGPSPAQLARHEQELKKSRLTFLREQAPLAAEQSASGVDQVRAIVQALKEFSHPEGDAKTPVDLNHLAQMAATVTRAAWRYHATLEFELADAALIVPGNPQAIGQVLINLLTNAADAIEARLQIMPNPPGKLVLRSRALDRWVELQVEDNGTGIPESIRDRVLEPFFTTKGVGKGTGQGLALAHSTIVEKHGGELSFTSRDGQGTTFFIRLPQESEGG